MPSDTDALPSDTDSVPTDTDALPSDTVPSDTDSWPSLDALRREEEGLWLSSLTEDTAYDIGTEAVRLGRERRLPISIGLWRGGHQLFHCGLTGSTRDNDEWLVRKGRVVSRFECSSLAMARLCRDEGVSFSERFALPPSRFAAAGGAVPLRVRGAGVVGWFGVSGLPQLEDHRFVVEVLTHHVR